MYSKIPIWGFFFTEDEAFFLEEGIFMGLYFFSTGFSSPLEEKITQVWRHLIKILVVHMIFIFRFIPGECWPRHLRLFLVNW